MENQPPTTNASAWLNRKPAAPDEGDGEVTRLKERLGFYESFDRIIQENVSRSSELLRHAAAMRENAEQELAQARREIEELRNSDRQEYRGILSGLLDDVTTMQVQIERLARRVSDALDDLEGSLPAGPSAGRLSAVSSVSEPQVSEAPPLPIEPTMDELLPPEPEGEAAESQAVSEPAQEVEAEVLAAEIETPEATAVVEVEEIVADAIDGAGEDIQTDDVPEAAESQPDTTLVMDEVVQEPADDDVESAHHDLESAPDYIGDGVVAGESTDEAEVAEEDVAPQAPAEENAVNGAPDEPASTELAAPVDEVKSSEPAPSRLPWITSDARPFTVERVRRPGTGELRMPEPTARASSTATTVEATPGVSTAVLVHGVPRATTALSLKRFLEGLSHITSVEPREYAEGVLRLQVTGQRPLRIDDLRGWADGGSLEPLHLRDDLIEVRLPT